MKTIIIFFVIGFLFTQTTMAQANLVLSSASVITSNYKLGEQFSFSYKIKNTGTATAGKSHTKIYLSPSTSFTNAIALSEVSCEILSANQETQPINYVFPIPYNVPSGTYYILFKVDSRNEVAESNENNNFNAVNTISVSNSITANQNIPYPIILVHGLISSNSTWDSLVSSLKNFYGWSYGGNMNFCLNQDGDLTKSNKLTDYKDWTDTNALSVADFYTVNFNTDTFGHTITNSSLSSSLESNQAGIVKQGLAIRDAVKHVLQKTGKTKVILTAHSMGGLASREYLQNSSLWQTDNQHHVAKLLTLGTPHGGSDASGSFLSSLLGIDEYSEALRDLKTTYYWSGDSGVYLFGGKENYGVMYNSLFYDFNNADVNCNGVDADNTTVIGLNDKTIPTDIKYDCVVGDATFLGGDGVVSLASAYLPNYRPVTADSFHVNAIHTSLTSQIDMIMKGLDEPGNADLAYGIDTGKTYFANFTPQSAGSSVSVDSDYYLFNIPQPGTVDINLYNIPVNNASLKIFDTDKLPTYSNTTNGKGYAKFSITSLSAGTYFMNIAATADNTSWHYPYGLRIKFSPQVVLPVAFKEFSVSLINYTRSMLQWMVAEETNIIQYEIERSIDGNNWIGPIITKASSNTGTYSCVDEQPMPGINYYRIKTIYKDGRYIYSPIRTMNIENNLPVLNVFYNPGADHIKLQFNRSVTGSINLFDIEGRKIITGEKFSGTDHILHTGNLVRGTYIISIQTEQGILNKKFVVTN